MDTEAKLIVEQVNLFEVEVLIKLSVCGDSTLVTWVCGDYTLVTWVCSCRVA